MTIVRASTKGQIVIPEELRDKYEIDQGTLLDILDGRNKIVILPMGKKEEGRGMLKGKTSLTKALLEERKRERARE